MVEFQQLFLIILIFTLTILLVIFSIFVFRILGELHQTIRKMNKIMDDMGAISGAIAQPMSGLSGLISGLRSGFKFFSAFRKEEEETDDRD